jgi:hypothetical protein
MEAPCGVVATNSSSHNDLMLDAALMRVIAPSISVIRDLVLSGMRLPPNFPSIDPKMIAITFINVPIPGNIT